MQSLNHSQGLREARDEKNPIFARGVGIVHQVWCCVTGGLGYVWETVSHQISNSELVEAVS